MSHQSGRVFRAATGSVNEPVSVVVMVEADNMSFNAVRSGQTQLGHGGAAHMLSFGDVVSVMGFKHQLIIYMVSSSVENRTQTFIKMLCYN